MNPNPSKQFNLLLGAGFSKALGDLPLTSEIQIKINDAMNRDFYILKSKLNFKDLTYEHLAHFIVTYNQCQKVILDKILGDDLINLIGSECTKYIDLINQILYQELCCTKVNSKTKEQKAFKEFINYLVNQDYIVNIIDLNHDNIVENVLSDITGYNNFFDN